MTKTVFACPPDETMGHALQQLQLVKNFMARDAKKAAKLEKKLDVTLGGYKKREGALRGGAAPLSAAQLEVVYRHGARCAGLTASGAALASAMEGLPLDGRSFDEVVAPSPLS